ncbi:MAG: hypothetical protein H0U02_02565 [Rubrobacter sp.]|jgi:hypothetical protein|nr:hypothetical protein [Rubrobacter sp.]
MDTTKTTAPSTNPAPECFACYEGVVYIGHLVEDDSDEEVEVILAVPCRRCAGDSRHEAAEVL